jgi:hypothetical protein
MEIVIVCHSPIPLISRHIELASITREEIPASFREKSPLGKSGRRRGVDWSVLADMVRRAEDT